MLCYLKQALKRTRTLLFTFYSLRKVKVKGKGIKVNFYSIFTKNTSLGNNCHFNGIQIRGQGSVDIGDNFHSGTDLLLITDNHNYQGNKIPYDESKIIKNISIGDNVWIGSRVTILGGVSIGEGAIIQAGSVVVRDIDKCSIVGGNPAKVFKHRDLSHYELLKAEKKFF